MGKICFVRHGLTVWNNEGRTQGISDIELSEMGIEQAKKVGKRLSESSYKIVGLYSSDLIRAVDTAIEIGKHLNIDVIRENSFRELSFGNWEGLKLNEIGLEYGDQLKRWRNEPHNVIFSSGDSLNAVKERSESKLKEIIDRLEKDEMIVVVSHAAAIKTMILSLLELPLDKYYNFSLSNASISIIDARDYGNTLTLYNDTSHLR